MRIWLEEEIAGSRTLDDVAEATLRTLRGINDDDSFRIGYVAGPISCDGDEKIPENIEALIAARTKYMHELGSRTLLFTAPFIFTPEVYEKLGLFEMNRDNREVAMRNFWQTVIASGLVDFVFFRNGYERSPGSLDEERAAIEAGIERVYETNTA